MDEENNQLEQEITSADQEEDLLAEGDENVEENPEIARRWQKSLTNVGRQN
ncbi:Hypothetical predicted protein [Paramuricea clavata]|uniref:Uncharacterized protein n=1 Tax=Paramuricea clavata TaxID=317549 RepID=A0A6S7FI82_PARCT|nr:Hypothetical predicted protein [Paramuricea clavata]